MAAPAYLLSFTQYSLPQSELSSRQNIRFLHPGYLISNTLLSLPRVDCDAGTTSTFGVHHGTALMACQIIAGNAFDNGHFTLDQAGREPVNVPLEGTLTKDVYYFIVGNDPDQYPVVPSFQDWKFPHDCIPSSWPQLPISAIPHRCGISNFSFGVEEAHLVPQEENIWYYRNDMRRYGRGLGDIDNPANILPLKSDLHKCFDKRWFTIVPKIASSQVSPQYVTHILWRDGVELWPSYHNTLVQYLPEDARPYLFARFAWAVLLQVKQFIIAGPPRRVSRIRATDEDKIVYYEELLTGAQLKASYGGGGIQRATPIKKRSALGSGADDDNSLAESSGEDNDVNTQDDWEEAMHEWKQRTERRNQQRSSETAVEEDNQATELKEYLEVLPGGTENVRLAK